IDEAEPLHTPRLYFTANSASVAREALASADIRDRFGTLSRWDAVRVDHMPLTADGVIDRLQLERTARGSGPESAPPRTDSERWLAELWRKALGVTTVSRDDNFFELGGDSLTAARLVAEMRSEFPGVTLRDVFDAPTLSALADRAVERRS